MGSVTIPSEDTITFKDFNEGNSVQVRTVVRDTQKEFEKGKTVTVVHLDQEAKGRIVSEPLVIEEKTEDGAQVLSLIVEKVS